MTTQPEKTDLEKALAALNYATQNSDECRPADFDGMKQDYRLWLGYHHIETIRQALSTALARKGEHIWIEKFNLTCCSKCGIVKRADDKNSPCKGVVKVELRDTPRPAQVELDGEDVERREKARYALDKVRAVCTRHIGEIMKGSPLDNWLNSIRVCINAAQTQDSGRNEGATEDIFRTIRDTLKEIKPEMDMVERIAMTTTLTASLVRMKTPTTKPEGE